MATYYIKRRYFKENQKLVFVIAALVFYEICILCKQMRNASQEKLCLKPMGLKLEAASKVTGKMD